MSQRLLLLRHGEVLSHRGDVPVSEKGLAFARAVGKSLGARESELRVLSGETLRTRQTAQAIVDGARSVGSNVADPSTSFAMRNPDIYVAGERVNLVSNAEALAVQIEGFKQDQASAVPFFKGFFSAPDRIEYWLDHASPPGESRADVARRVVSFAASLVDRKSAECLTIAVTHSPVLRACAMELVGGDTGEPNWVAGLSAQIHSDRTVLMALHSDAP